MTIPVPENYTSALYILKGKIKSLNEEAKTGELVNYSENGTQLVFSAQEDSELIAFGGEPIKEKVVSYGPFVMNSFEEIQQVMQQYETGKMGVLEW